MATTRYSTDMDSLTTLVAMINLLPLDELLATIQNAHTLGPILIPTEYRDGAHRLIDQERLVLSAIDLRDVARKIGTRS